MSEKKNSYILIAGAWHGGWIWSETVSQLREKGHQATALTLTGLGDRAHNATPDTCLSTHITDVLAHIEMEDLHDITLVGWSYGGMVISAVATQIPQRIRSLIYLDAAFPESGKGLVDYLPSAAEAGLRGLQAQGLPLPPRPLAAFGVTSPEDIAYLTPRISPQPVMTFLEPLSEVKLPDVPISYIYCSGYGAENNTFTSTWQRVKQDPRIHCLTIETNHFIMLSEPDATLNLLLELA